MQYAFYTGDSQGIETILKNLDQFQVDDALAASKSYQLAYGNWKLSQLYLQPLSDQRPRPNAKSLASKAAQAVCATRGAQSSRTLRWQRLLRSRRRAKVTRRLPAQVRQDARTASRCARRPALAPDNPRIKLVQAICAPNTAADPAAVERWRAVVASFEAAPPSRPGKPDWGHVEALTMLGETYLQRGDPVAARDALERALVLAPDYRQAQQLLQAAAQRPR